MYRRLHELESIVRALGKGLHPVPVFFMDIPHENNGAHILTVNTYPGGKVLPFSSGINRFPTG